MKDTKPNANPNPSKRNPLPPAPEAVIVAIPRRGGKVQPKRYSGISLIRCSSVDLSGSDTYFLDEFISNQDDGAQFAKFAGQLCYLSFVHSAATQTVFQAAKYLAEHISQRTRQRV